MLFNIPQQLGAWLSIVGTNLTTNYQGGKTYSLQGVTELDAPIIAVFDAASVLTGIKFRITVSDDGVTWDPILTQGAGTATPTVDHTLAVSVGATVRDRLQVSPASLTSFRNSKFVRMEAAGVGGAAKAGDSATSNLNITP